MQHYPTVTAVRQVSAEPIDVVAADDPTQQPGDITNPAAIQPVSPCAPLNDQVRSVVGVGFVDRLSSDLAGAHRWAPRTAGSCRTGR